MTAGAQIIRSSGAYVSQGVIEAAPITLTLATGHNPTAVLLYVLFFDTVAVPAAGAVPKFPIQVPGGGTWSWSPAAIVGAAQEGEPFDTGCSVAVSTTGDVYTPTALAVWYDVEARKRT